MPFDRETFEAEVRSNLIFCCSYSAATIGKTVYQTEGVGETDAGRVLVVVTTQRGEDTRVVTAHPADRDMRALYAQLKEATNAGDAEDT